MSDKQRLGALARGRVRTAEIKAKVLKALESIEREIENNQGIYPHNGGSLSKNEVARRAGVGKVTFFTPTQTELNTYVDNWLASLKNKEVIGRARVNASHAERAAAWKQKYEDLAQNHHVSELELQRALAEKDEVLALLRALKVENKKLTLEINRLKGGNVVILK
jgi:hypothetical protein